MRKINKKLMLSLSVLVTPFVAENIVERNVASANSTYNLTQNSKVYTNAQNAAKQKNATKTYSKGTYYIYKQYNGMINISKTPGKAGAWINPSTNKPVVATQPKKVAKTTTKAVTSALKTATNAKTQAQTSVITTPQKTVEPTIQSEKQTTKSNTYILNTAVKTYTNAVAAKSQKDAKSTYNTGNYFIFKEYNGMLNISRVAGRAGAWINPTENVVALAKKLQKTTEKAKDEVKAPEKVAEASKVEVKTEQKQAEVPKVEEKISQKPTEQKITTKLEEGQVYNLSAKTGVYTNAALASSKTGATRDYDKGQYYIYKIHNGMINISKTKGKVGAWINPTEIGKLALDLQVLPFANKNYTITSPYGVARNIVSLGRRDIHDGVDFITNNNEEPILATEAGTVIGAGLSPYGDGAQHVVIKHGENSYTAYWHLARNSVTVKTGQEVKAGQKIGVIGTTGLSTGIHLHFMHATTPNIFRSHQDPIKYLKSLNK